jgi:hypothetical protein
MSLFKGDNSLGARDIFITRAVYDGFALTNLKKVNEPTIETLQIKDFRKDEKILYGRIDASNNPIHPKATYLKPFPSSQKHRALDFVVAAFEDMKKKFERHVAQGYIRMDDPIFSSLNVQQGFISPVAEYRSHVARLESDFKIFVNNKSRIDKISDFDSFLPFFMEYVELTNPGNPITRSMFLLTNQTTPLTSGLIFDIHKADAGNDAFKIQRFYKQRNFEYFKNLAFQYGFVLDKHIPWRLIADINSPAMTKYIQKALNTDSANGYAMLRMYFSETYSRDVPSLANLLLSLYNSIVQHRPFEKKPQPAATVSSFTGKTKPQPCKEVKVIRRKRVHMGVLQSKYPPSLWLDLYTKIRNLETGMLYNQASIESIVSNAIDLENRLDTRTAMRYIISKFDNVEHHNGSFFHDTVRLEMAEDPTATEAEVSEKVQRSVQASNFVVY